MGISAGPLLRMSQAISAPIHDCQGAAPDDAQRSISTLHAACRWFLIFTKPSGECTAQANLQRQGYRVYYPRVLQAALYRGHWAERIVSLFPRYVFLQLDSSRQSLGPVRSTLGVSNIVRSGREFTIVPNEIVERLMQKADPQSGLHRLDGSGRFRRGGRVNVISGAFEGLEGIFEREAGADRVVIMLKLLGQDTTVRVPSRCVVSVEDR